MEDLLKQVAEIKGVKSVLVGGSSGEIYTRLGEDTLDLPYPDSQKLCREMVLLFAGLHAIGRGVEEMDISFEDVRAITRGLHGSALITLCSSEVDISMLRLTLNVVLAQIKAEPKFIGRLPGWERILKDAMGDDFEQIMTSLRNASGGEV